MTETQAALEAIDTSLVIGCADSYYVAIERKHIETVRTALQNSAEQQRRFEAALAHERGLTDFWFKRTGEEIAKVDALLEKIKDMGIAHRMSNTPMTDHAYWNEEVERLENEVISADNESSVK